MFFVYNRNRGELNNLLLASGLLCNIHFSTRQKICNTIGKAIEERYTQYHRFHHNHLKGQFQMLVQEDF